MDSDKTIQIIVARADLFLVTAGYILVRVCAVSDHPVGVDVEEKQNADIGVMNMCFQPIEREWIDQAEDQCHEFTRLWTRKESYLKLRGTGLTCLPNSFCVLPGKDFPNDIIYSEKDEMGHMICVCTQQNDAVIFKEWNLQSP